MLITVMSVRLSIFRQLSFNFNSSFVKILA